MNVAIQQEPKNTKNQSGSRVITNLHFFSNSRFTRNQVECYISLPSSQNFLEDRTNERCNPTLKSGNPQKKSYLT
jgi:hypothetical protein